MNVQGHNSEVVRSPQTKELLVKGHWLATEGE